MLRSILAVLLCTLAPAALAQDVGPPVITAQPPRSKLPAPPPPTGRITGTVFCSDTHRPARGATVILQPLAKDTSFDNRMNLTRTDVNGTYTLGRVAPGEYAVLAFFPGYALPFPDDMLTGMMDPADRSSLTEALRKLGTVTVSSNAEARGDVSLTRGAAVQGRVLYSDGAPAAQVLVEVKNINAKPPKSNSPEEMVDPAAIMRSIFSQQKPTTDDEGHFRIAGLAPGTYRVAALQTSPPPASASGGMESEMMMGQLMGVNVDPTAVRVFSGDTLHQATAKTYDLSAGDTVSDITITIPLTAFHRVAGTVEAVDGRHLNFANLTLTDASDATFTFHTNAGRDGAFAFANVPAGTYTLATDGGFIGTSAPPKGMEHMPEQYWPLKPETHFAGDSQNLIVADSDKTDVLINLKELPKDQTSKPSPTPTPTASEDDDQ